MTDRVEEPLTVNRLGGAEQLRDWRTRRHCGDPICIANYGDEYCSVRTQDAPEVAVPEAAEGVGAAVIDPGTSETLELPETPVQVFAKRTGRRADRRDKLVKTYAEPVKFPYARGCGHQFHDQTQPRMKNCDICWNAYFWNQNEFTENISRNIMDQGPGVVEAVHGTKFLKHFLRFAKLLARYEHFRQTAGTECAAVEETAEQSAHEEHTHEEG
jgi:hypothetical protein